MLLFADSRAAVRAGVPGHGRHRDGGPGHRNHRQHQVCQVSKPASVWEIVDFLNIGFDTFGKLSEDI